MSNYPGYNPPRYGFVEQQLPYSIAPPYATTGGGPNYGGTPYPQSNVYSSGSFPHTYPSLPTSNPYVNNGPTYPQPPLAGVAPPGSYSSQSGAYPPIAAPMPSPMYPSSNTSAIYPGSNTSPVYPGSNMTPGYPSAYSTSIQPSAGPPFNTTGGSFHQPGAPPFEPNWSNQGISTSQAPSQSYNNHQEPLSHQHSLYSLNSSSGSATYSGNNSYSTPSATSSYTQQSTPVQIPTVVPANPFDPRRDAETLKAAMKGFGTNEQALIDVLCRRTSSQRTQIVQMFKSMYGKDLMSRLKSELSFNFLRVMIALTRSQAEFLACELHDAMKGLGTKEHTLIEILCSTNNQEKAAIKAAYRQIHSRNLEDDIKGDTSGDFCRILIAVSQGQRDENQPVSVDLAKQDAQRLYAAGEGRMGTDESTFISIFATRSWNQLRLISSEYQHLRGRSLETAIRSEFSGWLETTLQDILHCASDRNAYFARRIKDSTVGAGTRDKDLIRIIVSRCDQDLASINNEYQKRYGSDIASTIVSETSGDYKKALLALVSR